MKAVLPIAYTATQAEIDAGLANNLPKGTSVIVIDANNQPIDIKVAQGAGAPPADSSGMKNNFAGIVAPATTDDSGDGYTVGSRWIDTVGDESYICVDATLNNAVWSKATVGTIAEVSGLQTALDLKSAKNAPIQDYSATATYAVGDQIIQSLKIYECKTAITAGETFTASKWDEISVGATGAKAPTIHVAATTLAITEASHNNAEIHLEGTGNLTILNTDVTSDTFGFTVINTDAGATRTLTPTGFTGVFKRSGGTNIDLTNVAFNIADNAKYRFTVTLVGTSRYLNIEDLNPPTELKTINGEDVRGTGNILIVPTTVSTTTPTHNLDLVTDNYVGRALHLRPNGMIATTNLATWNDSSGNSRSLTQATPSLQPDVVESALNGYSVIRFDADDKMARSTFDVTANHSIFAVVKTGATIVANHIISEQYAPDNKLSFAMGIAQAGQGSTQGMFIFGMYDSGWFSAGGVVTPVANTNYILSGVRNQGTNISLFVNGNAAGVNNTTGTRSSFNATKSIYLAATWTNSDTWNGDMAEVVVFPTALSTTERQKVEGYLAHKYALLASLDVGHPYKVTSPKVGDLQTHADNAAATTAGLTVGQVYMTATGQLMVRF